MESTGEHEKEYERARRMQQDGHVIPSALKVTCGTVPNLGDIKGTLFAVDVVPSQRVQAPCVCCAWFRRRRSLLVAAARQTRRPDCGARACRYYTELFFGPVAGEARLGFNTNQSYCTCKKGAVKQCGPCSQPAAFGRSRMLHHSSCIIYYNTQRVYVHRH